MILIKPETNRQIEIPGVAVPVPRPVDIDQANTGFHSLRTLRIYCFESSSVIEGHAEEDEVFIVVLSGSIELTMFADRSSADPPAPAALSAPGAAQAVACAAYLPPQAAYRLVATTNAEVAYARATPSSARSPRVFLSPGNVDTPGVSTLLQIAGYAEKLSLRLVKILGEKKDSFYLPVQESEAMCEALVHIRSVPVIGAAAMRTPDADAILMDSWDTVSVAPGDRPILRISEGASAFVLIVAAC